MIDRHWFILIVGVIGAYSPRLSFAIIAAYMAFLILVQNGYILL